MKKIVDVLFKIFAVGMIVCLFAGGISLLGYLIAMVIGGETATAFCTIIFKTYLPWVIRFVSVFTFIGLIAMYLSKQKALTFSTKKAVSVKETEE